MELSRNDKIYSATISLASGIILILLGILVIVYNKPFYIKAINILLIVVLLNGFIQVVKSVINKRSKNNLLLAIINLVFALILLMIPEIPQSIFPFLLSQYLIIYSIIKLMICVIFFNNHVPGIKKELLIFIVYSLLGISILLFPLKHIEILLIFVGIYFISLGAFFILTSVYTSIPIKYKNKFKRKIRIHIPLWLETIVPFAVLTGINKMLEVEEYRKKILKDEFDTIEPDVEIVVHVSNRGMNRVGHVDFIYKNEVYSYGNYDDSSKRFYEMIGDGILFHANKKQYIPFCIKHSKKTLFSFGLKLSEEQKKQINDKFKEIEDNLVKWHPPYCYDKKNKDKYGDYASELYKATKAEFYKFKVGKFKTYFVFGASCCDIVNEFIGSSGIDLLKMNGIISPGTYYDCLNREYINKTGMVISRKIYNQDTYIDLLKNK